VFTDFISLLPEHNERPVTGLFNCWEYVKSVYPHLPPTAVILNAIQSEPAEVVVFYYPDIGLYHYAVLVGVDDEHYYIEETNYKRGQFTQRQIPKNDVNLIGFFAY
jgi:hypothetical protein